MFLFGPIGGLAADRLDKRRVLYVTQTLSGLLAGVFAVLIATGTIEMWMVYLLALALGGVTVFDNPARQSFIPEMVHAEKLSNAVSLNSVSMSMARVFGAALGGVFVAVLGLAACFALNGVSFEMCIRDSGEFHAAAEAALDDGEVARREVPVELVDVGVDVDAGRGRQ